MVEVSEIVVLRGQKDTIKSQVVSRVKRDRVEYLDRDTLNLRISNIPVGSDRMFCQLLWMTGIRITEAINIRKRDLDFPNQTLTIRWLKSRKWNDRIIPIRNDLGGLLSLYSMNLNSDDLMFNFKRLRGFRICKKWLLVHPHAVRHSYAVNYLRQGGRPDDLRQLLGHKSFTTTQIYTRLVPKDLKESIEKIQY